MLFWDTVMSSPPTLETERLRLRQWTAGDRAPFAALNADPDVMAYFPAPLTRAESDWQAERCEHLIAEHGWGFWACELKSNGIFIGFVGLNTISDDLPIAPGVEIGWRLDKAHWRHGYATEAARGALKFGFETLGLAEIVAFTAVPNIPSRAVMERLGMQRDPATFEHPRVPPGPLKTHVLYRLSRPM